MSDNLINNKTPIQCLNELMAEPERTKENFRGFDYIPIEDFYQRLWNVFGKENVIVTQPSNTQPIYTQLSTGQVSCSVYIEIEILYDNGASYRKVGSWGESELIYSEKSGAFDGLNNVIDIASTRAFKNALKKLDIFGTYSSESSGNKSKPAAKSNNKPASKAQKRSGVFSVRGVEPIVEVRKDNNTGLPVYTWKTQNEAGNFNVIFYPNKYTPVSDWMGRLVLASQDKPNTLIEIKASELDEKEGVKQLIFEGLNK